MGTVTDIDGNVYDTVVIGAQEWTVQNFKCTKLNDGTAIPEVTGNGAWNALTTPGRCAYDNNNANRAVYGELYNWYAASANIAPAGWRIPTDADWSALLTYVGGLTVAGGKLKETGTARWSSPNTDATDEFGFKSIPGGYRHRVDGFYNIGYNAGYYSQSVYSGANVYSYNMYHNSSDVAQSIDVKNYGYSLRLVRDYNPIAGRGVGMEFAIDASSIQAGHGTSGSSSQVTDIDGNVYDKVSSIIESVAVDAQNFILRIKTLIGDVLTDVLRWDIAKDSLLTPRASVLTTRHLSYYSSFAAAITAIGSTVQDLIIDRSETVSANTTSPLNINIKWQNAAQLTVADGVELIINSMDPAAPLRQLFTLTGTGKVVFSVSTTIDAAWFGWAESASAATNDAAFTNAVASMVAYSRLHTGPGTYNIEHLSFNPVDGSSIPVYGCKWENYSRLISGNHAGVAITIGNASYINYWMEVVGAGIWIETTTTENAYDWTAGRIGCKLLNLGYPFVKIHKINGFTYGLNLVGDPSAVTGAILFGGRMVNNKECIRLQAGATGYVNANRFIGNEIGYSNVTDYSDVYALHLIKPINNASMDQNDFTGLIMQSGTTGGDKAGSGIIEGGGNTINVQYWEGLENFVIDADSNDTHIISNCPGFTSANISDSGVRTLLDMYGTAHNRIGIGVTPESDHGNALVMKVGTAPSYTSDSRDEELSVYAKHLNTIDDNDKGQDAALRGYNKNGDAPIESGTGAVTSSLIRASDNATKSSTEMVTNGTFASDVSGWSTGGTNTIVWNPAGKADITINQTGNGVYQSLSLKKGQRYILSFVISSTALGTTNAYIGVSNCKPTSKNWNLLPVADGTYDNIIIEGTAFTSQFYIQAESAGTASTFTIDSISIKPVAAGRIIAQDETDATAITSSASGVFRGGVVVEKAIFAGSDISAGSGKGFQIAGAAASGKYLRGDGTRFVAADLNAADARRTIRTITGTDTVAAGDDYDRCNSAADFALTLPPATGSGKTYTIKNIGAGTVTLTADTSGTPDTIDGDAVIYLYQYDSVDITDAAANAWDIN